MAVFKIREAIKALKSKGFTEDNSSNDDGHTYFYLYVDDKITDISTHLSHRPGGDDIRNNEIKGMKNQMKLDTLLQVHEFVKCTLSLNGYLAHLRQEGHIPPP